MSEEVNRLTAYLQKRPIAPILAQSDEKQNLTALKFMVILDHETERNQLYTRMRMVNSTSLMLQLMQFHKFESFTFYDYSRIRREMKTFVLQCSACGLIASYACIMVHMAVNHNLHMGSKMCGYCDRAEIQKHIDNNTLDRCCGNYLRERNITKWDTTVCKIVAEFYDMLKIISEKFSVVTFRNHNYAAKRYVFCYLFISIPLDSIPLN